MLNHNISTQPDNWNDYFTQQVTKYQSIPLGFGARPEVGLIDKTDAPNNEYAEQEPIETYPVDSSKPEIPEPVCPVCDSNHLHIPRPPKPINPDNHMDCCVNHHHPKPIHPHRPCSLQHKPIGMVTPLYPYGRFEDDDKPDWHIFNNPNRQPRLYIEVIDKDNPCGPVHLKPLEPVINPKDEIEEVVDLDNPEISTDTFDMPTKNLNIEVEEEIIL